MIESWFRILMDGHFLRLACRNREAEFQKLGRNFVIMGLRFNNRELQEVTESRSEDKICRA